MAQTLSSPLAARSTFALRFPRDTRLLDLLRTWRRRIDEKAQLAAFDARDLRDVGLTGADRSAIINTPFWREAEPRR